MEANREAMDVVREHIFNQLVEAKHQHDDGDMTPEYFFKMVCQNIDIMEHLQGTLNQNAADTTGGSR